MPATPRVIRRYSTPTTAAAVIFEDNSAIPRTEQAKQECNGRNRFKFPSPVREALYQHHLALDLLLAGPLRFALREPLLRRCSF